MNFIESIVSFIINTINSLGYWGIGIGMALESACIPIPSEIILPLGGNMVANGTITMLGANIVVAIGSLAGSLIAYAVGYYGGRPFILKYGKYFFVSEKHFYKAEDTFNKHGVAAVFFGRLLPIIRTFISLPAGIAKMDLKKFVTYSLIGMLPWNFMLIYLGFILGPKFEEIVGPIYRKFEYIIVALILIIISYLIIKYKLNKNPKKSSRKKNNRK